MDDTTLPSSAASATHSPDTYGTPASATPTPTPENKAPEAPAAAPDAPAAPTTPSVTQEQQDAIKAVDHYVPSEGWVLIGREGDRGVQVVPGTTVRYGIEGHYSTIVANTSYVDATNEFFHADPVFGVAKVLERSTQPPVPVMAADSNATTINPVNPVTTTSSVTTAEPSVIIATPNPVPSEFITPGAPAQSSPDASVTTVQTIVAAALFTQNGRWVVDVEADANVGLKKMTITRSF